MASWLAPHLPIRKLPRLWVERVWLVESREPLLVTRTIELHPGVNVVWAREPESSAGTGIASAGHGVGKTSLCLLLRYLLGDDATAITTLRDKAAGSFPKGGVAAKVHVDGVLWTVFRPYGAYSHSWARMTDSLESLFEGASEGDFQAYAVSLEAAFIGGLTAPTLPGTNQSLEWRHLLAWCIRDQKTRFDGFFHWRDGEGLGFRRPRKDPPLFVNSVLGLLDVEADKLMRAVELSQSELDRLEAQIPELERAPVFALAHLERQLRSALQASEDEPVFESIVEMSLETRFKLAREKTEETERQLEVDYQALDDELLQVQLMLEAAKVAVKRAEEERDIAKALAEQNESEYLRLTTLANRLEGLVGMCEHGWVEFSACQHVVQRRTVFTLPWRMDEMASKAAAPVLRAELTKAELALQKANALLLSLTREISDRRASLRRLQVRIATSVASRDLLKKQWDELQLLMLQRTEGLDAPGLRRAREREKVVTAQRDRQRTALMARKSQQSQRTDSLKALTRCIAMRLLGEVGYGRFNPDSDSRPFDLSKGGEAYQVLEVLLGDLVCLVDAATSGVSSHPGFLVHDCPREADMSERLYKDFVMTTFEAAVQLGCEEDVPFQYIVTTTSSPPDELRKPPHLILELLPGSTDTLLFKRDLSPQLPGLFK